MINYTFLKSFDPTISNMQKQYSKTIFVLNAFYRAIKC